MTWDIRPGMRVVCVDGDWPRDFMAQQIARWGAIFPIKGRVYTIRNTVVFEDKVCVRLVELVNPDYCSIDNAGRLLEPAFRATRFRPLDETRLDIFRSLLVDVAKEEELA